MKVLDTTTTALKETDNKGFATCCIGFLLRNLNPQTDAKKKNNLRFRYSMVKQSFRQSVKVCVIPNILFFCGQPWIMLWRYSPSCFRLLLCIYELTQWQTQIPQRNPTHDHTGPQHCCHAKTSHLVAERAAAPQHGHGQEEGKRKVHILLYLLSASPGLSVRRTCQ